MGVLVIVGVFIIVGIYVIVKIVGLIILLCVDDEIEIEGFDFVVYGECVYDIKL